MGLTIHYHGRIKSQSLIPELVAEVEDICQTMNWAYTLIDRVLEGVPEDYAGLLGVAPDQGYQARGISFQMHEKSERVTLCFGPDGLTLSPMALYRPDLTDWADDMLAHHSFTKTQFAGVECHVAICRLLKYLAGKYFLYLEVTDEGNYYETEDLRALEKKFGVYGEVLDQVSTALQSADLKKATSIPDLLNMLTEALPGIDIRVVGDTEEE